MPKPDYTSLDLPGPPPDRPYVLMNMVMSADGKAVVEDSERGLGSKTDQRLMRELRVNADVVVNGASTLRVTGATPRLGDLELEGLRVARGKPRLPMAAIITRSGDLPLDRAFFTARDFEAIVYLSGEAPREQRAVIEATGRTVCVVPRGGEVRSMLWHMRHELGANVVLVEGGPSLNAGLFAVDAVDEYFTTVGPVVVGGHDTLTPVEGRARFPADGLPRLELVSAAANHDTDEVYLHYRVRR